MRHIRILDVRRLTILFAILLVTTAGMATGGERQDKLFKARQRNAMKQIQQRLTIKPVANVEEMWYVLAFSDHSVKSQFSSDRHSDDYDNPQGSWTMQIRREATYGLVKGRKAATTAVYEFTSKVSESANNLDPAAVDYVSRLKKDWDFRAFRSAKEAEAFYVYHNGSASP